MSKEYPIRFLSEAEKFAGLLADFKEMQENYLFFSKFRSSPEVLTSASNPERKPSKWVVTREDGSVYHSSNIFGSVANRGPAEEPPEPCISGAPDTDSAQQ